MNEDLIKNLYLGHHKEKTLKHAEEVAETAVRLAEIHHLDPGKTRIAALLHDISAIMTPQEMYGMISERHMPTDPAEEIHPCRLQEVDDAVNGILDYAPLEMAMKAEPEPDQYKSITYMSDGHIKKFYGHDSIVELEVPLPQGTRITIKPYETLSRFRHGCQSAVS